MAEDRKESVDLGSCEKLPFGKAFVVELSSKQAQQIAWAHRDAHPEEFEVVTLPASELENILQELDTPQKLNNYWQEWLPLSAAYTREVDQDVWRALFATLFEPVPRKERVLEVGCGWSPLGRYLPVIPHYTDVNPRMCELLRSSVSAPIICTGYHPLALGDATYNVVLACNTLDMTNHPDVALAEFQRVLRPGGSVIVVQDVVPSAFATVLRLYMSTHQDVTFYREKRGKESVSLSNGGDDTFIDRNRAEFLALPLKDASVIIAATSFHLGDVMAQSVNLGFALRYHGTIMSYGDFAWTEETRFYAKIRRALAEGDDSLPEHNHQRVIAGVVVLQKKE